MSPTALAKFERWFPVYLRYLGSILGVVLVIATVLGYADPVKFAGAYSFVTLMILYKTVDDYKPKGRGERSGDDKS